MMEIHDRNWELAKKIYIRSVRSTMYCSVATIGTDGEPHISPIGSLFLTEPGKGYYFEEYLPVMRKNLEKDGRICVMAVNAGMFFWLSSLRKGRFASMPGIRLYGRVAAKRREATEEELHQWFSVIKKLKHFRGYDLLWGNMKYVRDVEFYSMGQLTVGKMTAGLSL